MSNEPKSAVNVELLNSAEQLLSIFTDKFFAELIMAIQNADQEKDETKKVEILTAIKEAIATMVHKDLSTAVATYTKLQELKG